MDIGFPVFTIEMFNSHAANGRIIQAANIYTYAIRMRAGNIKRLDPAGFTKQVFCFVGIKGIARQVILTGNQVKFFPGHDQV